jgi:hypothetical protein
LLYLFAQMRIPVVLDFIISPSRQSSSYQRPSKWGINSSKSKHLSAIKDHLNEESILQSQNTYRNMYFFHWKIMREKKSERRKIVISLPVTKELMKPEYQVLFLVWYVTSLNIWSKMIHPSQPAALTTSIQICSKQYDQIQNSWRVLMKQLG